MQYKKIIIFAIIIILAALILLITANYVKKNRFQPSSVVIDESNAIEMTVLKDTITQEGLSYCIKNNSNETIYFTDDIFSLEFEKNGGWYKQPVLARVASMAMKYEVAASGESTVEIKWPNMYGKIEGGKYRLVKPISIAGKEEEHFVVAEFIVEGEK